MSSVLELDAGRGRRVPGATDRSCSSSTLISSSAQIATICCAKHVRGGLRGITVSSIAPARMRSATTRTRAVGPELREDAPLRNGPELVAGVRPLQAAGDRLRTLDLDHEVAAPMSIPARATRWRRGRDSPSFSSSSTSSRARGERTDGGARDLFLGQLVQAQGEPLRESPVVDEHDRRPVLLDGFRTPGRSRADPMLLAGLAHVPHRNDHAQVELLPRPASTSRCPDRPETKRRSPRAAAGWRRADALHPARRSAGRALYESARWAPRFVPATACTSSRMSVSTLFSISRAR